MKEVVHHAAKDIFSESYVFDYEKVSASSTRPYERNAKTLADLASKVGAYGTTLEVGCGTGNSTIVFAESDLNINRIIGIDPSGPFLELAKYKFGKSSFGLPADIDRDTITFIENQRERGIPFSYKVDFVLARADGSLLPIKKETIDIIFAASVMHWLAFKSFDSRDREYIAAAFADLSRVLKPGGKLIFDCSGLQFDFGEDLIDGKKVNSLYWLNHSFHTKFLEEFTRALEARRLSAEELFDFSTFDNTYHAFDLDFLRSRLAESGLEIVPVSSERLYHLRVETLPMAVIKERIIGGGRMRYFNTPQLRDLPSEIKDAVINKAFSRAELEYDPNMAEDGAEIMAAFIFQKR